MSQEPTHSVWWAPEDSNFSTRRPPVSQVVGFTARRRERSPKWNGARGRTRTSNTPRLRRVTLPIGLRAHVASSDAPCEDGGEGGSRTPKASCEARTVFKTGSVATSDCLPEEGRAVLRTRNGPMAEEKGFEPLRPARRTPAPAMQFRYPAVFRITPPAHPCRSARSTTSVSSDIVRSSGIDRIVDGYGGS